jgi:hypothetical protein
MLHEHPENAYLDLGAAGEVLAGYYCYSDFELFDDKFLVLLEKIRSGLPNGEKNAKTIKNSMYQVKRRFMLTLDDLVNDQFFAANESQIGWTVLHKDKKIKAIKAAYDLRSRYVHTGLRFGDWMTLYQGLNAEVMMAVPNIDDSDLRKLLVRAPMFHGLERMIRYALLRFAHQELCPIDDRLDDPPHGLQDEHIAVAAYYNWERDKKPSGQEKKHWTEGIKQLKRSARAASAQ